MYTKYKLESRLGEFSCKQKIAMCLFLNGAIGFGNSWTERFKSLLFNQELFFNDELNSIPYKLTQELKLAASILRKKNKLLTT